MDWRKNLMDALWGFAGSVIGVIGALGFSIWSDKKAYTKIRYKIGELNNTTLSGQHNEISGLIKSVKEDLKSSMENRAKYTDKYSLQINSKVDNIIRVMDKSEGRYENLNLDQREVRNNVNKLVNSWEILIKDNKELKELVVELQKENQNLKDMIREGVYKNIKDRNNFEDEWELER